VAHEIRTPLTYVTNNLFLIRQRLEHAARSQPELGGLVDEVVRYGKAALDGVARIDRLVEDLRRFARRDEGGPVEADLRDVVGMAVDLFRATRRGRIDVRAELRSVPSLRLDTGQVQQVVLNLLTNAAEAMPSGGLVRIGTRAVPGGGEIEVEDHGDGIAPDVQDRLFHPFFTTKAEGTGLGLSISHRIIESHGGHIRFESHVGRGTTFFVFLPLREADRRELSA
jgi:signal transduction histidine kinase